MFSKLLGNPTQAIEQYLRTATKAKALLIMFLITAYSDLEKTV